MTKKYFAIYLIQKKKCINYKDLTLKYILNNKFFFKFNKNYLLIILGFFAKYLLLIQIAFPI